MKSRKEGRKVESTNAKFFFFFYFKKGKNKRKRKSYNLFSRKMVVTEYLEIEEEISKVTKS